MSKKGKIRVALGSLLALTLVVTCAAVYQSGSKSTPNEKELVKENEEDSVDQAIKTEEREETEDANTSEVEGTRETETTLEEPETPEETTEPVTEQAEKPAAESASAPTQNQPVISQTVDLNFTESSLMQWPVNGQVVLDYNMENTVYFPTLNVYKLNPAVSISAEAGAPVTAVANGKVLSIVENEETGTTVTLDMGNGYQAVYGQLKDVPFQAEEYVSAGSVLGYVNEPTKYYTKEGTNLYFALTKDGTPLDPMQYLP